MATFQLFFSVHGTGGSSRGPDPENRVGDQDNGKFRPWSAIPTGNHLDRTEKIPKVAPTTGTVDVFHPLSGISGPTSRRASACPNLHE